MTKLTHAHMNKICVRTVLESSVMQIEGSVLFDKTTLTKTKQL